MLIKLRNSIITLVVFLIPIAIFLTLASFEDQQEYVQTEAVVPAPTTPVTAHLSFVGDIMLDRGVKLRVQKYSNGDYHYIFEHSDFLKEPDLMFANLEGPVSTRGANVGSIYSFRFDPIVLSVLKDAGFDVLSMANNHIGDWGRMALEDTLTLGKENGFDMVGGGFGYEDARTPVIREVNGIKIGYLGFSDFGPPYVLVNANSSSTAAGVLSADDPFLSAVVADAKAQVDVLVVSFHFGDEYKLLSNDRQKRLAHTAIDAGADIVAGHHPHVAEETEAYNGGVIAYSLGNFIFDQSFSEETMRGVKLDVMVTKEGMQSYSTSTIQLNANYQPMLAK
jgi:poly-gamma-glutamate synthesis protein (capsule biosynthesis protein)